ncbi:MAG: DNA repair protein RecO [Candidatus Omnitrophica bacterium]|nr:DNA repair protein RecO [Candidatus Omnitrophota bacterium]
MAGVATEAIVLKKIDFRETSVLLDLLTVKMGKIRGVLKGVRTSPSRVSPLSFQAGSYIFVVVYPKRANQLPLLHAPQLIDTFFMEEPNRCLIWQLMLRILNIFLPEREKNNDIVKLILATGRVLKTTRCPWIVYLWFKIRLVGLLGYGLEINQCIRCHRVKETWLISARNGGLICLECSRQTPDTIPVSSAELRIIRYLKRISVSRLSFISGVPSPILEKINFILNLILHYHSDPGFIWWANEKNIFTEN